MKESLGGNFKLSDWAVYWILPIQENKGHYCVLYAWYSNYCKHECDETTAVTLRGEGRSNSTGQAVFTPPEVSGRGCKPWDAQWFPQVLPNHDWFRRINTCWWLLRAKSSKCEIRSGTLKRSTPDIYVARLNTVCSGKFNINLEQINI